MHQFTASRNHLHFRHNDRDLLRAAAGAWCTTTSHRLSVCLSVCLSVSALFTEQESVCNATTVTKRLCLSVCLFTEQERLCNTANCLFICLPICLSVSLSVCCSRSKRVCVVQRPSHRLLSAFLSVCLLFTEQEGVYRIESVTLPVYLPICLSFCLSPCLSVCYSLSKRVCAELRPSHCHFYLPICLSVSLSVCCSLSKSVCAEQRRSRHCLSVTLPACQSVRPSAHCARPARALRGGASPARPLPPYTCSAPTALKTHVHGDETTRSLILTLYLPSAYSRRPTTGAIRRP